MRGGRDDKGLDGQPWAETERRGQDAVSGLTRADPPVWCRSDRWVDSCSGAVHIAYLGRGGPAGDRQAGQEVAPAKDVSGDGGGGALRIALCGGRGDFSLATWTGMGRMHC